MIKWLLVPLSSLLFFLPQIANAQGCEIASSTLATSSSLKAYYRFQDNSNDSKGTNNGTATNVSYVSGNFGNAGSFDRTQNSRIVIPDSTDFDFGTGNYTIYAWVKTSNNTDQQTIYSNRSSDATWRAYILNAPSATQVMGETANNYPTSYDQKSYTSSTFSNNVYHQLVLTKSGTTRKFYENGQLFFSTTTGSYSTDNTNTSNLGNKTSDGGTTWTGGLTGQLDDVAIFNQELSATDITDLYNNNTTTPSSVCYITPSAGGGSTSSTISTNLPQGYTLDDFLNRYYNEIVKIGAALLSLGLIVGLIKAGRDAKDIIKNRYGNNYRDR